MIRNLLTLLMVSAILGGGASTAAASDTHFLEVDKKAQLLSGGTAVALTGRAACPEGAQILEAFVYVTQNGVSTTFAGFSVPCDGTPHSFAATAHVQDGRLRKGKAQASGYFLVLLPSGETASTSPTREIKLK